MNGAAIELSIALAGRSSCMCVLLKHSSYIVPPTDAPSAFKANGAAGRPRSSCSPRKRVAAMPWRYCPPCPCPSPPLLSSLLWTPPMPPANVPPAPCNVQDEFRASEQDPLERRTNTVKQRNRERRREDGYWRSYSLPRPAGGETERTSSRR